MGAGGMAGGLGHSRQPAGRQLAKAIELSFDPFDQGTGGGVLPGVEAAALGLAENREMATKGKASLPQAGNLVRVQPPLGAMGVVGWGACPGDPQATAGPEVQGYPL